ncbi:hypothetical protein [Algivirga pacifica]|uniref:Uncharacterized protein n=1 Tax=Algivirga pacifica TaxID=1162670 RepID=A0ABP9D908_9BACT
MEMIRYIGNRIIDLLVVMLAVSLPMYLLYQQLGSTDQRTLERQYLTTISYNMRTTEKELKNAIAFIEKELIIYDNINAIRNERGQTKAGEIIEELLELTDLEVFPAKSISIYESVALVGDPMVFSDFNLNFRLYSFYYDYGEVANTTHHYDQLIVEELMPFMRRNYDFYERVLLKQKAFSDIYFTNLIFELERSAKKKREAYQRILKQCDKVQKDVDSALLML